MIRNKADFKKIHKRVIDEFVKRNSSSHLISNLVRSRNLFSKILFIVCFLISTAYCVYSIARITKSYYKYDTVTSLKIKHEIPTNFPAVSFCNLKAFNKLSSKKYLNKTNNDLIQNENIYGDDIFEYFNDESEIIESKLSNLNESVNFRRSLGFELKDMLVTCYFNWKKCDLNDFKYFYHPLYGNCFTFNSGDDRIKKVNLQGAYHGLSLELFMGDPMVQTKHDYDDELIVSIHNQSNVPRLNSERILASVGKETDLKVNRNFISKLGPPYSKCLKLGSKPDFNSEFYDYIVNTLKLNYSQQHCYLICLQKQVISRLACSSLWLPVYKSSKYCTHDKHHHLVIAEILEGESIEECQAACLLDCEFVEYKITVSQADFPTPYYQQLLSRHSVINRSGINVEDIHKAVLRINVF